MDSSLQNIYNDKAILIFIIKVNKKNTYRQQSTEMLRWAELPGWIVGENIFFVSLDKRRVRSLGEKSEMTIVILILFF